MVYIDNTLTWNLSEIDMICIYGEIGLYKILFQYLQCSQQGLLQLKPGTKFEKLINNLLSLDFIFKLFFW